MSLLSWSTLKQALQLPFFTGTRWSQAVPVGRGWAFIKFQLCPAHSTRPCNFKYFLLVIVQ
jgi:hypothetical protein